MLRAIKHAALILMLGVLGACGDNADNKPTESATKSITGSVPSGEWTITVSDASGAVTPPVVSAANGSYIVNVSGRSGPFIVQASPPGPKAKARAGIALSPVAGATALYAYIQDFGTPAPDENLTATVNVSAMSTFALQSLSGSIPSGLFAKPLTMVLERSAQETLIEALLRNWFTPASRQGADPALDLLAVNMLTADVDTMLKVYSWMDDVAVALDNDGSLSYLDPETGLQVQVPVGAPGKTVTAIRFDGVVQPVGEGVATPLQVNAIFSDASSVALNPALVTFSATDGATVSTAGVLLPAANYPTVTAEAMGHSTQMRVAVARTAALDALEIVGAPASLASGDHVALNARALYVGGATQDGVAAEWSLDNTHVATVDSLGVLTAKRFAADETVRVSATLRHKGVTRTTSVSIVIKKFENVISTAAIVGPEVVNSVSQSQYRLLLTHVDGLQELVNAAQWSVNNDNAQVNAVGQLTAARLEQAAQVTLSAEYIDPLTAQPVLITPKVVAINRFILTLESLSIQGYQALYTPQSAVYLVRGHTNGGIYDVSAAASWHLKPTIYAHLEGNILTAANTTAEPQVVTLVAEYRDQSVELDVIIHATPLPLASISLIAPGLYNDDGAVIDDTLYVTENTELDLSGRDLAKPVYVQANWGGGVHSRVAAVFSTNHSSASVSGQTIRIGALSDRFTEFSLLASYTDPADGSNTRTATVRVVVQKAMPAIAVPFDTALDGGDMNYVYSNGGRLEISNNNFQLPGAKRYFTDIFDIGTMTFVRQTQSDFDFGATLLDPSLPGFVSKSFPSAGGIPYQLTADGSIEINTPWGGGVQNERITAVVDLAGTPVHELFSDGYLADLGLHVDPAAVFSPGAKRFRVNNMVTREAYRLDAELDFGTGPRLTTLDEYVAALAGGASMPVIPSWYGQMPNLTFRAISGNESAQTATLEIRSDGQIVGTGKMQRVVQHRKDMILLTLPTNVVYGDSTSSLLARHFISEHQGALWFGSKQTINRVWTDAADNALPPILNTQAVADLQSSLLAGAVVDTTPLPTMVAPVAAGHMRVHWNLPSGLYREGGTWGVYSWLGPLNPSSIWPSDRIKFTHVDAYGALVDIPMDPQQSLMSFLIINGLGDQSKFDNCAADMSVALSNTLSSAGQEIWLKHGDCTVYSSAPPL